MDRGSWQGKSMRSQRVGHNWMAEHAHAHTTLPKDCWKDPNVVTIKIVSCIWKHFPNVFYHVFYLTCQAYKHLFMVWNGDTNSPGSRRSMRESLLNKTPSLESQVPRDSTNSNRFPSSSSFYSSSIVCSSLPQNQPTGSLPTLTDFKLSTVHRNLKESPLKGSSQATLRSPWMDKSKSLQRAFKKKQITKVSSKERILLVACKVALDTG